MRGKKWTVLWWLVAVMIAGALTSALLTKRAAERDTKRAEEAALRWYGPNATVKVSSCRLLSAPTGFVGGSRAPDAFYECTVKTDCAQRQTFAIPVPSGEISTHALARPYGPPTPRRC